MYFLIPVPFNFLNETGLGIKKNKQVGSRWGCPVPNPLVVIPSSECC